MAAGKNLVFLEETPAVQEEVDKLTAQGVNKIIALGHAGYSTDIEIAKNTVDIDIIVGGHSDTFLYTGLYIRCFSSYLSPTRNQLKVTVQKSALLCTNYSNPPNQQSSPFYVGHLVCSVMQVSTFPGGNSSCAERILSLCLIITSGLLKREKPVQRRDFFLFGYDFEMAL